MLHLSTVIASSVATLYARTRVSDRGEGVISTAIAVLVMALLGAAMWVAFSDMFTTTTGNAGSQVSTIGT